MITVSRTLPKAGVLFALFFGVHQPLHAEALPVLQLPSTTFYTAPASAGAAGTLAEEQTNSPVQFEIVSSRCYDEQTLNAINRMADLVVTSPELSPFSPALVPAPATVVSPDYDVTFEITNSYCVDTAKFMALTDCAIDEALTPSN